MTNTGQRYYECRGRVDKVRRAKGQACATRYILADQIDLVWEDLCGVLRAPEQIAAALERAQGGHWLPQEMQARQATLKQALGGG